MHKGRHISIATDFQTTCGFLISSRTACRELCGMGNLCGNCLLVIISYIHTHHQRKEMSGSEYQLRDRSGNAAGHDMVSVFSRQALRWQQCLDEHCPVETANQSVYSRKVGPLVAEPNNTRPSGHMMCDNKPLLLARTTVPLHTDSLVISTKTKVGLVTEDHCYSKSFILLMMSVIYYMYTQLHTDFNEI